MTIQSTTGYWSILEKSELFDDAELADLRQRFEHVKDAALLARKLIDARLLTDWQARFLLTGRHHLKVGQYVLLERISSRVVGDRFLAIHKGLDRQVEVNLFPASIAKNRGLFQQFLTQASRVVGMDHRNLVHLYDIEREGTRYYFVYEHDTGTPLDKLVPGQIDVRTVADITRQILDGIGYAHQNHLIHGQLNESQVRIDEKNQIRISDVGLATMMDQLAQLEGKAGDAFGNRPLVDEDTSAAGKIGLKLLEQHAGESVDSDYLQLKTIFRDLSLVVKHDDQTNQEFITRIDEWTRHHIAAQAAGVPFEPLPTSTNAPSTKVLSRRPAKSSTSNSSLTRQTVANSIFSASRGKRVGTMVGGFVAVLFGGFAFFLFFGRGNSGADLSRAKSLERTVIENKNGGPLVVVSPGMNSGKARTSKRAGSDKSEKKSSLNTLSGSPEATDADPSQTDTLAIADVKSNNPDRAEPDLLKPGNTNDSERSASIQETTRTSPPVTQAAGPPESNSVSPPVIGGTWNGRTVIDWKNAAEFIDQEAVVSGRIVSVTRSGGGAIYFLNFDKSTRDTFTVIIRETHYDKFPGDIESLYKNKAVVVTGKIFLFQDRVPEIEVTSSDQIDFTSEMASDTAEMAEGKNSPAGGSTTGITTTSEVARSSTPFANLPPVLAIPDFDAEDPTKIPLILGEIDTGDELLGMEVVTPNGYGKKGLVFTIDRDATNVNRWEIRFAERVADIPVVVAEITKVERELRFQWIAPAGTVNSVNYLRNCLVRIKSPADSKLSALRTPVEIEPIVFNNKKPNYRENLPVTFIPDSEFIVAQLQPFSLEDLPGQNSENGYEVSARQPATEVYFEADALQRFLAIGFRLDTGSQIKIESSLLHNSLSGFLSYRESTFNELGASVFRLQLELQNKKLAADNYDPVYGEKGKHKDYVKELSRQLDLINQQVEGYNAATERLQKILDRPVHFRVIFKSDDVEIELARTKGWEIIGNAAAATETK